MVEDTDLSLEDLNVHGTASKRIIIEIRADRKEVAFPASCSHAL